MPTIRRAIAAGALSLPIALGTAGIASADTGFDSSQSTAGPHGAETSSVSATAGEDGSSFEQSSSWADPDGASSESTESYAHPNSDAQYVPEEHESLVSGLLGV